MGFHALRSALPMKTSIYETVKTFELRTDLNTTVRTEVSARNTGVRRFFRLATFRVYQAPDGAERRSPWLGLREFALKQGLEKAAADWMAEQIKADRAAAEAGTGND